MGVGSEQRYENRNAIRIFQYKTPRQDAPTFSPTASLIPLCPIPRLRSVPPKFQLSALAYSAIKNDMSGKGTRTVIHVLILFSATVAIIQAQPLDTPRLLGAIEAPQNARFNRVCVRGRTVYAGDVNTLAVIDVSNPTWLRLVHTLRLPIHASGGFFISDSRLLASSGFAFTAIDTTDPHHPRAGGREYIFQPPLSAANIGGVYLTADTAVVNLRWPFGATLETFDVSDPAHPTSLGLNTENGSTANWHFMKSSGTLSFAYQQRDSLTVLDCSNARVVRVLSTISFPPSISFR